MLTLSPQYYWPSLLGVVLLLLVAAYLYRRYWQSRPTKTQDRLLAYEETEARSFYRHLVGELDLIPPEHITPTQAAKLNEIKDKVDRDQNEPSWDDLLSLELILHQLLPPEYLLRKTWITRLRYYQVLGPAIYAQYLATNPPRREIGPLPITSGESALVQQLRLMLFPASSPPSFTLSPPSDFGPPEQSPPAFTTPLSPAEESSLRADLQVLLQETYWALRLRTAWEARRNWFSIVFKKGYLWTLAIGTLLVYGLVFAPEPKDPRLFAFATFFAVALAGTLGGFISMLQRLQSLPEADPKERLIELIYGRASILWQSLLSGASFALVLMLLFVGGLVSGQLFPKFENSEGSSFIDLLMAVPTHGVEFAKLLVWSFIAGFAERFVPDLLDRFTAQAANATNQQQQQQTPQQQTAPMPPPPPPNAS
jgi:hypothetical protein